MSGPYGLSSLTNSLQFASTRSSSLESTGKSSISAYPPSSVESEISCATSIEPLDNKNLYLQLKNQLLGLWKEGGELQYAIFAKSSKNREFIDKQHELNAKFIRRGQDYWGAINQANKCRSLREKQTALRVDPATNRVALAQIAKDLAQNSAELKARQAEWEAGEAGLKIIEQAQTEFQQQYQTHLDSLNKLQERAESVWQQIEILLLLEKQTIKNMHAQGRKDPHLYQADIKLISRYIDNFEADFAQSYVMLKPSVYQMLRISISVLMWEDFADPIKANLAFQETFVIDKLLELKKYAITEGAALRQNFSMEETILIKSKLTREIRNARGKLEQEEIPTRRNLVKIGNIRHYLNALIESYFEVSEIQQEIAQLQNICLDYAPDTSISDMV